MRRVSIIALLACSLPLAPYAFSRVAAAPAAAPSASLDEGIERLASGLAAVRRGKVVLAKPGEIYVDLGEQDGVRQGMELSLSRPGEEIRDGEGKVLGRTEQAVGRVRVEAVTGPRLCKAVPAAGGEVAAQQGDIAREVIPGKRLVAVTQFTTGGKPSGLTWSIQHLLQQRLAREGFQVVERDALSVVLGEAKLGATGLVDDATAARIGKAAAAQAIVLGSVVDAGQAVRIYARLVDTESASQLRAESVEVRKAPQVAAQLTQPSQDAATAVRIDVPQDPDLPGGAPAPAAAAQGAGPYHSAVTTRVAPSANIEMIRSAARQKFEGVRITAGQLAWCFPSGNDGFLSAQGLLVVAGAKPLDGLAQRDVLDTDLASAIDLLSTLFPEAFTETGKYAVRFDSSTYYADQAGVLHRVFIGINAREKVPDKVDWTLSVPPCRVREARLTTWNQSRRGRRKPAVVTLDGNAIECAQTAAFNQGTILPTWLLDGPHRLVVGFAGSSTFGVEAQFGLIEVVTDPTEKRFFVSGPLAQRARVKTSKPISTLWPGGQPEAAPRLGR